MAQLGGYERWRAGIAEALHGRSPWMRNWLRDFVLHPRQPRLKFRCNACGRRTSSLEKRIARETPSCGWCGSNVRVRALIRSIGRELFGTLQPAPAWPEGDSRRGLGFSDPAVYAAHLARSTHYANSWFHTEPYRDLLQLSTFGGETFDYVVCSEVLEHVNQPVQMAIDNLFAILRPGGVLFLTVPARDGESTEHFPALTSYEVFQDESGDWVLSGTTDDGAKYRATELLFHGGPGSVVEMRVCGRDTLHRSLTRAGFVDVWEELVEDVEIGVAWRDTPEAMQVPGGMAHGLHSGVWVARKAS